MCQRLNLLGIFAENNCHINNDCSNYTVAHSTGKKGLLSVVKIIYKDSGQTAEYYEYGKERECIKPLPPLFDSKEFCNAVRDDHERLKWVKIRPQFTVEPHAFDIPSVAHPEFYVIAQQNKIANCHIRQMLYMQAVLRCELLEHKVNDKEQDCNREGMIPIP